MPFKKRRLIYLLLLGGVIALGLGTRRYPTLFPVFMATYGGDALWAVMVFLLLGLCWPRVSTPRRACIALAISYLDEIGQLYHAPWIDAIRRTTLGGLVLGWGFLWSDLACYTVGIAVAALIEGWCEQYRSRRPVSPGV